MLSKLNYFRRKEERNVYKNHFVRSHESEKEEVFKRRDSDSFLARKALKLVQ